MSFVCASHEQLFFGSLNIADHPQLYRMQDYYADTFYQQDDLEPLLGELDEVIAKLADKPAHAEILTNFRKVVKEAAQQNKNVYLLCD